MNSTSTASGWPPSLPNAADSDTAGTCDKGQPCAGTWGFHLKALVQQFTTHLTDHQLVALRHPMKVTPSSIRGRATTGHRRSWAGREQCSWLDIDLTVHTIHGPGAWHRAGTRSGAQRCRPRALRRRRWHPNAVACGHWARTCRWHRTGRLPGHGYCARSGYRRNRPKRSAWPFTGEVRRMDVGLNDRFFQAPPASASTPGWPTSSTARPSAALASTSASL